MSLHADLLGQAAHLARKEPRRPSQASLRRAVSASYYALGHLLIDDGTKLMLSGCAREPLRHCPARAFHHGTMKRVSRQFSAGGVSEKLLPGVPRDRFRQKFRCRLVVGNAPLIDHVASQQRGDGHQLIRRLAYAELDFVPV